MQAAMVREPLLDLHPRNGPGLAPFRTLTQFMQVIYRVCRVHPTGTFCSRLATFDVHDQITIATSWQKRGSARCVNSLERRQVSQTSGKRNASTNIDRQRVHPG